MMLARTPTEVADMDGLTDLYCAVCKMAVKDLSCADPTHRATARYFLEQAGLLQKVIEHYGIEERNEQLALFT